MSLPQLGGSDIGHEISRPVVYGGQMVDVKGIKSGESIEWVSVGSDGKAICIR